YVLVNILSIFPRSHIIPQYPYTSLFRSPRTIGDDGSIGAPQHGPLVGLPSLEQSVQETRTASLRQKDRAKPNQTARRHPKLEPRDRKSTRLNSSHVKISYAVFCLKKKKT